MSATLLHHPHSNAKTSITVDASDRAVGGKLEQFLDGLWCPVAFFSRKLTNAERKYSAFGRELLAIFLSVKHFRHHIKGHQFTIFTDHKPLTFAFASAAERSPRQTRHMSFIITSDRGPQFTSHMWSELNCLLEISASNTMAYHPQGNKLVECFHRQLKGSLKAWLQGPCWMDELLLVLLSIRTAWLEGSDCSASELVYGTCLRILANSFPMSHGICQCPLYFSGSSKTTCELPLHPQWSFTVVVQPTNLTTWHPLVMCMFTMMPTAAHCCGPLQRPYDGLFKILEVHEKYYVLDMNGCHDSVSIDRLKTAYGKQTYCRPALVPPQPVTCSYPTRAALSPPITTTPQPTVHSRSGRPIKTQVCYL